jgi:hypothetical protein
MPTFITRVEMHGVAREEYDRLHSAMERRGFIRTITSGQGVTYRLPTAEYWRSGTGLTSESVRSDAQAAAGSVRPNPSVLVAETTSNWYWANLQPV